MYVYMIQNSGFIVEFLDIIALISFLFALFTIIAKNPVTSVLNLIFLFGNIALYLIFLGIVFIGISYLLVYVGAVSILFLFILMLINIRVSELTSDTNNSIPLAILAIIIIYVPLNSLLPLDVVGSDGINSQTNHFYTAIEKKQQILYVSSNNWDGAMVNIYDIVSIGNTMYTNYSIWLIITSIILLLAMVGSIIVASKVNYD